MHLLNEHVAAWCRETDIRYKDSLVEEHGGDVDRYSLVLANPPSVGSLDDETTAKLDFVEFRRVGGPGRAGVTKQACRVGWRGFD